MYILGEPVESVQIRDFLWLRQLTSCLLAKHMSCMKIVYGNIFTDFFDEYLWDSEKCVNHFTAMMKEMLFHTSMTNTMCFGMKQHLFKLITFKYSSIAVHFYNTVKLTMDSLKRNIKIYAVEPETLSFLSHAFFFLAKTWCLHYPKCNSTADSSVGDLGVLC